MDQVYKIVRIWDMKVKVSLMKEKHYTDEILTQLIFCSEVVFELTLHVLKALHRTESR